MERLTKYDEHYKEYCRTSPRVENAQLCEKLGKYEDLEEQCIKENSFGLKMLLHKWKEFIDDIHELYKYRELEKQGKLLKLPCAVGDTVYYRHDGNKIEPMQVEEILIAKHTSLLTIAYSGSDEKLKYWRVRTEITAFDNKVIFLTREEAEAALKELEG